MNNAVFVGNLGRDRRVGTAGANNTPYMSFPIGVEVGYGEKKHTLWIGCTIFGKRAEGKLGNWLGKGAKVAVQGEIDLDQYTKGDGTQGATISLKVNDLSLLDGKEVVNEQQAPASQPAPADAGFDADDIPF